MIMAMPEPDCLMDHMQPFQLAHSGGEIQCAAALVFRCNQRLRHKLDYYTLR